MATIYGIGPCSHGFTGISPHLATKRSSIFDVRISRFERVPFGRNLPRSDCRGAFFSDCEQWDKVGLFETAQRPYARWCFKMDGNSGWAVQVLLFGISKLDSKASCRSRQARKQLCAVQYRIGYVTVVWVYWAYWPPRPYILVKNFILWRAKEGANCYQKCPVYADFHPVIERQSRKTST